MVQITDVLPHSRGEKCGIIAGDTLVSLNGHEISDVLDYRFYLAEKSVDVKIMRDGTEHNFTINKDTYDDIGLDFETPLMDKKHSCENKCIFCFIDQLPRGMRKSLYFKDDDSRLSFLHGNYITLTNLKEHDIQRIIDMHISPVNVSVHTTNSELRVMMMKNKHSGEVLAYLKMLADGGCMLRCQIVLCRGINDGAELERTMNDLAALYPAVESVSVVPAGLTKFRDGLYPLTAYSPEEAGDVIRQVTDFADKCEKKYGERIFYAADELYVKSGTPMPPVEKWGEFTQIENGVGMIASFESELDSALLTLTDDEKSTVREVSVATGAAAYKFICACAGKIEKTCRNIKCHVYKIDNNFFGTSVTVTGLITGVDLADQLKGKPLGDTLLLSRSMLRQEGDLFLCGMTPAELEKTLGVKTLFNENDGASFLYDVLGI